MRLLPLLSGILSIISVSFVHAAEFPGQDWETTEPSAVGIDPAKLAKFVAYNFAEPDERKKTDAVLVIRGGKIAYERYAYGYSKEMRHLSWSVAKSFSSVLIGIAESEGLISRTSKMSEFYPRPGLAEGDRKRRDQVDVLSLLSMSSGIDWIEDYSAKKPLNSDVIQMLYMDARKDNAAYVASRPTAYAPGERFYYSTGDTTLALGMLKHQLSAEAYARYPWERLFDRIGMKNVVWERDQSGTFDGGSYIYATARDYARFGYLLLNEGRWKDQQVMPREWLGVINTLSSGLSGGSVKPGGSSTYGAGFWLNQPAPKWGLKTPFPDAPADTYFALGHNGQMIVIIPSRDLVAIRLAHDAEDNVLDWNRFFGLLVASTTNDPGTAPKLPEISAAPAPIPARGKNPPFSEAETKHTSVIYFTKLLASVRAKDFCSCHFVVGQSVAYCKELVRNGFKVVRMSVNEEEKIATFGLLPAERAQMTSEEFGCEFL